MTPTDVVAVALRRVRLPLRAPHVAAHGTERRREVLLVAVTDADGTTGWGECPTLATPGYTAEWTDGAWARLRDDLLPTLLAGHDPAAPDAPMALGAVRDARWDLDLRRTESAPPGPATSVPFGVAVGLAEDVDAVLAAAAAAVAAGAALVVLKVRPGWSAVPLAAVRAAFPDLAVAVDANGSFAPSGPAARAELRAVDALGPVFVEQPLPAAAIEATAVVAAELHAPVALDESVVTRRDLAAAVSVEAGSILTVKPARVGGHAAARELMALAHTAGWDVHVGGMLESGLGRAAARRLAALPEASGAAMVGPTALLFTDDVVDPVAADASGRVPVPRGPGLAPAPDAARLARLTVERWEARA